MRRPRQNALAAATVASVALAVVVVSAAPAGAAPGGPPTPSTPTAPVTRTVTLPRGASIRLDANGVAHEVDAAGHETAQRVFPAAPALALGSAELSDSRIRAAFAPAPDTSAVIATLAPTVGLTGASTPHPAVPGERSAVTSNTAVNAAFARIGARTAHALLPQLSAAEAGAVASAATSTLGTAAPDLARTVVVDVTGDPAAAAAILRATPGVTFAEGRRAVVGMNTGSTPLPTGSATTTTPTSTAANGTATKPGVYPNAALTTSAASFLNANGVDAVPAWSTLAARTGALPGTGTRITNVSVGDLTDASMKSDPYVAAYGPTTVVDGGQRFLDLPSLPLIPTYTASGSGTLDPLGSTTGQDPALEEVLLDFGVMAPLPHGSQRAGATGDGPTDLLGIAPGASYRLVVPQVPTNDQIAVALVAAARQTPKPDVITASLGFGTDTEGYPGRYLEDDPVLQATIAAIVHRYGVVVTISANDGTRLYTPASVGPDGGSTPTDRTSDPASSTTIDDDAESTTPSKILDSGALAIGSTTLDDTLAAPLSRTGRGATNGTLATTRLDGSGAYSSGFGTRVDLSAPGDGIAVFEHTLGGSAQAVSPVLSGGTSASAPMVAATSALVIQAGRLVGRSYTPDQVRKVLTSSARAVASPAQTDRTLQVGPQVDAGAAVAQVLAGSGPASKPAIVRVSLAHRVTQSRLGGSFTEATDPGRIDLETTSGEGLVGPVTFGLDVTGLRPAAATYSLRVGTKTWKSSTPSIRITPTELLTAAGLPVVATTDRTVTYTVTVAQGTTKSSATRTVVVGPTDGTYAEGLAPITAPTVAAGSGTSVTWDLRGARVVTHPMLVVSHVGHWNPALGPVFSPAYRVPLEGDHGTAHVPASAFTGGGGVYGIGIAQQTEGTDDWAYDIYSEFASVRVVGSGPAQRPAAPLLDGGHTTTVSHTDSTYRLSWNVGSVAGATGAVYEISAAGPTLYNALNTVTNQNGTTLDQDGVNSGSVAHGSLAGRSGSVTLDAAPLGLDAVTFNVRVLATAGDGSLLGQASPTSSLVVPGVGVPGGGSVTDFAVAGADSLAVVRPAGATGSSVVRFNASTGTTGAALTSDGTTGGGFQLVGVDAALHRAVVMHYLGGGKQLAVETWATNTRQLVRRQTFTSSKTLVLGGAVDGTRHRAVLLAQDAAADGADLALTVALRTGVVGKPVALDGTDVPAGSFDRVDVDPDTGAFLFEQLRVGGICFAFGAPAPLARFDAATGTVTPGSSVKCSAAAAVVAGHEQLLEFSYRSFSLNAAGQSSLVPVDLTTLTQGTPVLARVETPRTLAADGAAGVALEGYPYPLGHPRFGSAAGIQTDNNATAQFDVAPLTALGAPTATLRGFGFSAPLGEWDGGTVRRVQLDPATHTGWTLSLDGSQVQRFSYPVG
ncbi:peptidase S8 [Jatrophihabitans sp. YIM 134969]